MAEHKVEDIALAALTLNIGLMQVLEQKGLIQNQEGKDIMNAALDTANPEQREAIAAIFADLGAGVARR